VGIVSIAGVIAIKNVIVIKITFGGRKYPREVLQKTLLKIHDVKDFLEQNYFWWKTF
jgi:hypothetical protein